MKKRYINVAYKDREMAKRLGARWDASVKRWYCPPDSPLAKIYSWRKAPASPVAIRPTVPVDLPVELSARSSSSATPRQLSLLG